jgi:hypothetical protein
MVMLPLLLAAVITKYDVLISAGHEGRPANCAHFPQHKCNLGAAGEREWTPTVADEATKILREHGVSVVRLPADFEGTYRVKAAIFIHFDGSNPPCGSRASVGYPSAQGNSEAKAWRALYGKYWPFGFQPDDFTEGLREYYGYRQVQARDGVLVVELGEITCPVQHGWLQPRLQWEGALLARFLSRQVGEGSVPSPGPFGDQATKKPF